ncbi:MAG: hypothetical protein KAU03_00115 [Candidatus Altiarchaeales archaeon]|nr:hypothetical protein [Candidatus Altiarchaeales archaeon]
MEKSLLIQLIGGTPANRIIDFLIENKGMDYSKTAIAEGARISRASLFKHWDKIEDFNLAKETRRFGKTKLYTLNTESELVQELMKIESMLIKKAMDGAYEDKMKEKVPVLI